MAKETSFLDITESGELIVSKTVKRVRELSAQTAEILQVDSVEVVLLQVTETPFNQLVYIESEQRGILIAGVGGQGPAGLKGDKGDTGAIGLTGPQGPIGLTGLTGAPGGQGIQGIQGIQGLIGVTGAAGPKGDIGATGLSGPQGVTGDAGPQGIQGTPGAAGATGPQGLQGLPGATGAPGAPGDPGSQGEEGPVGAQGEPGLVWDNTSWQLTKSFTVNTALEHNGSSFRCKTAHISSANTEPLVGFDWQLVWMMLAKKGATGAIGAPGPQGIQGVQGVQGELGPQGATGNTGVVGPQGVEGPQGVIGPQGVPGVQGPDGLQGAVGPQGVAGIDGQDAHFIWIPAGWIITTAYVVGDNIGYNGSAYTCILAHTAGAANEPEVGGSWGTYWSLMAAKGATGMTGADGEALNWIDDPWFISSNYIERDALLHADATYRCILAHLATGVNEPGTGGSWQTYWKLVAKGQPGPAGSGVPAGGLTGQALLKQSPTDFDATWGNIIIPSSGLTWEGSYYYPHTFQVDDVILDSVGSLVRCIQSHTTAGSDDPFRPRTGIIWDAFWQPIAGKYVYRGLWANTGVTNDSNRYYVGDVVYDFYQSSAGSRQYRGLFYCLIEHAATTLGSRPGVNSVTPTYWKYVGNDDINLGVGEQTTFIPVSAMYPPALGGTLAAPEIETIALGGGTRPSNVRVAWFSDTSEEFICYAFALPANWDWKSWPFFRITFHWLQRVAGTGGVAWRTFAGGYDDGDSLASLSNNEIIVDAAQNSTTKVHITTLGDYDDLFTISGENTFKLLTIGRVPSDAGDTLVGDAGLLGIRIRWYSRRAAGPVAY